MNDGYFITKIEIKNINHLSDISIDLSNEVRKNLIVTGKNGSGKTTLLKHLKLNFDLFNGEMQEIINSRAEIRKAQNILDNETYENGSYYDIENRIKKNEKYIENKRFGLKIEYNGIDNPENIFYKYKSGGFILAYFPALRMPNFEIPTGVEKIENKKIYTTNDYVSNIILKYMVHLKTQLAYAREEKDLISINNIKNWFKNFEESLRLLIDDESIKLSYDYKNYNFYIEQNGKKPFRFTQLPDGYASIFFIYIDLLMRMEHNWLQNNRKSEYNDEGIVLIDEIETHLHIELQEKILPTLTTLFPRIQFIVSTHSPYILSSARNAIVYDLEKKSSITNIADYSAQSIAEGFFDSTSEYSTISQDLKKFFKLLSNNNCSEEELAERGRIRSKLLSIPRGILELSEMGNQFLSII